MNRNEYISICAMEECSEVAQAISKLNRFGNGLSKGSMLLNSEKLIHEFNELFAAIQMMQEEGIIPHEHDLLIPDVIEAKKRRINLYYNESLALGTAQGETHKFWATSR